MVFMFIISLVATIPALATVQYQDPVVPPCELPDVEECFWQPMGIVGGNFYNCNAVGAWGQGCYDVVEAHLANGHTINVCAKVLFEAHCSCDTGKLRTYGYCNYRNH